MTVRTDGDGVCLVSAARAIYRFFCPLLHHMSPVSAPPSRRIPSLDGLRAVSILLVLLNHATESSGWKPGTAFPWVDFVFNARLGVMLFFGISGFIITYLLAREIQSTGTINLRGYYKRRILRIFPAF